MILNADSAENDRMQERQHLDSRKIVSEIQFVNKMIFNADSAGNDRMPERQNS
jgi:hypothetical protein